MTTIHYESTRYKFWSKFYLSRVRISLIIRQERIQTMVIVFNTVFKLIWYLKVNILELSDE